MYIVCQCVFVAVANVKVHVREKTTQAMKPLPHSFISRTGHLGDAWVLSTEYQVPGISFTTNKISG